MSVVALSHGYPPLWNMGGEVALHRAMSVIKEEKFALSLTEKPYKFEGVNVKKIDMPNVLDINSDPKPIAKQLKDLNARVVIAQNELSLPSVLAAQEADAISIVNVHTPPKYGKNIYQGLRLANYGIYNTRFAAKQWGERHGFVLHPPTGPLPNEQYGNGDAYTLLSSLVNKGVGVVIDLAKKYPDRRFIIVRSPAEKTHGLNNIEDIVSGLTNVELYPRVAPEEVYKYLKQTRILLVPSRYETYGMSAIEAAGYGIPSIHVDTPHVREGIGEAAVLISPLSTGDAIHGINLIEKNYEIYSSNARKRAEWLQTRQSEELEKFSSFIENLEKPNSNRGREKAIISATKRYFF